MSERTPEGSDRPEPEDEAMLAVLSNSGRRATALSPDDERLLDDWVAGRLHVDEARRAATLTRRNALAAERILERRLRDAARKGPPVPEALTARIFAPTPPRRPSSLAAWWQSLGRRQWLGVAGIAALAGVAAIAVAPMLQQVLRGDGAVQVAMVTFADRTPLFEPSDVRMRGSGTPQATPADQRFRDLDVPSATLRSLLGPTGPARTTALREMESYLPAISAGNKRPVQIIVDAALKARLDASSGPVLAVRLYDLGDPRAADIRRLVAGTSDDSRLYLLTLKP